MAFSLPPPPNGRYVDDNGLPTSTYLIYLQQLTRALTSAIQTLADVTGTILPGYQTAIDNAQSAAAAANAAASAASQATQNNAREQALVNSYIDPDSVLTATPTSITIAAHTRHYADGTTAAVNAGTASATAAGDIDYVSYSDPTRMGGAVTYQVSTTQPPQTGSTHVVGAVMIPTVGSQSGGTGPRKPGYVDASE